MTATPKRMAELLALARANLAQARAQLCSHGISPRICKDRHDTEGAEVTQPTTETGDPA